MAEIDTEKSQNLLTYRHNAIISSFIVYVSSFVRVVDALAATNYVTINNHYTDGIKWAKCVQKFGNMILYTKYLKNS